MGVSSEIGSTALPLPDGTGAGCWSHGRSLHLHRNVKQEWAGEHGCALQLQQQLPAL
jgi:hypothetical protein